MAENRTMSYPIIWQDVLKYSVEDFTRGYTRAHNMVACYVFAKRLLLKYKNM